MEDDGMVWDVGVSADRKLCCEEMKEARFG